MMVASTQNVAKKPKVYIVGVGMTKFYKPKSSGKDYPELVREAVTEALGDAGVKYKQIQQATASYMYGGSCCGQRALYEMGLTGIPIFNLNNACASGSSGIFLCKQIIESGNVDLMLAVGFEKMNPGSLEATQGMEDDRTLPVDKHIQLMADTYGLQAAPITSQMFGNAGREHMEKYGTRREHFAKIAYKNHLHSVHNPKSQFQKKFSLDEVVNARKIYDYMGLLECSPTSDGAAAVVICSERFLEQNPQLKGQAVEIVGIELGTDEPTVFSERSNIKMVGFDLIKRISERLYTNTGVQPDQIQVMEVHDCFAPNELITYEALGLCPVGKAGELVDRGDNTYGGKWVVNPSGGLISKGHPIGATGIAQAVELSNQLRGRCGVRQVPNAIYALQHNIGIGGAGVVAIYKLGFPQIADQPAREQKAAAKDFKSDAIFEEIRERAAKESELSNQINSIFKFVISRGADKREWTVDLKSSPPFVGNSPREKLSDQTKKADAEIALSDDTFVQMAAGKLKPDQAFMQGKMKIRGNIMKAMKLKAVLDPSKLKARI
uniref:Sterol carrier protein 2 n=1 Tax=Globodera rostochiensis TaxID=31243 RepID=A0A914GYM0_GLORO